MEKSSPLPEADQRLSVAFTTAATKKAAKQIAQQLIEERLVACAQIDGPILSLFYWDGALQEGEEYRITLKFPTAISDRVESRLKSIHPYDTPEWVVITAERVSSSYLTWVIKSTYGSS